MIKIAPHSMEQIQHAEVSKRKVQFPRSNKGRLSKSKVQRNAYFFLDTKKKFPLRTCSSKTLDHFPTFKFTVAYSGEKKLWLDKWIFNHYNSLRTAISVR
jgi:hypothetical protein